MFYQVQRVLDSPTRPKTPTRKRKRSGIDKYTPDKRAKIANYAIQHGVMKAHREFNCPESTVRNFKKAYSKIVQHTQTTPDKLEVKQRGRPCVLGQYDKDICDYVTALRQAGGIIIKHHLLYP